ncbi:MAG: magnesium chelatase subunit D family protein [Candidatus Obscuribacterales bacterium]|nr:magnesium chelatase subunit D family protein [Candidatus Obscuribacterales bacterium]
MTALYPFSAIVGQEKLKLALMICAVNPSVGGVLIVGDKGTAKSTAARGVSELLQPIETTVGCSFNCFSHEQPTWCEVCSAEERNFQQKSVPFVNLPIGATEDRVLGSLDIEKALKQGARTLQPGLLAQAHRGILYIDEVNLLPDHLVDILLDVAAMGVNTIQREGMAIQHNARLSLIGTMNREEGDIRPQLLDRFGLMVEVTAQTDWRERSEVVRRRIAFELSPPTFTQTWSAEQESLRIKLDKAVALLDDVEITDSQIDFISQICCEMQATSLRADIVLHKVCRTLAALDGRCLVSLDDIQAAAGLVLPHRRRRLPTDKSSLDQEKLEQMIDDAKADVEQNEDQPPPSGNTDFSEDLNGGDEQNLPDQSNRPQPETPPQNSPDKLQVYTATKVEKVKSLQLEQVNATGAGKRGTVNDAPRGFTVRAVRDDNPSAIAVEATLRHSIARNSGVLCVEREDLHQKVRSGKSSCLIIFAIDSSGSMAARKRMELVKGCIEALLQDAYVKRDSVSVISFSGTEAQISLGPSRSVEQAYEALAQMPTGGRTPLPHALALVLESIRKKGKDAGDPLLVLLSDGKANVPLTDNGDAWSEALQLAAEIAMCSIPCVVVDTESGHVKLGRARKLADVLNASYASLEAMTADDLTISIRSKLGRK